MRAHYYPDRWVTIVTGEVIYVGSVTLLDGHTPTDKNEADKVQALRFDVRTRIPWRRGYDGGTRRREFWCLHLGARPSFLTKGARVIVVVRALEPGAHQMSAVVDLAVAVLESDAATSTHKGLAAR